MSDLKTELAQRMIARADADGLPEDHDLRQRAWDFEDAAVEYWSGAGTMGIKTFMGHWARARRAWSDYTGEPLI